MFHEKALVFLRSLFRRWKVLGVSHSLSIVLFCRCYIEDGKHNECGVRGDAYRSNVDNDNEAAHVAQSARTPATPTTPTILTTLTTSMSPATPAVPAPPVTPTTTPTTTTTAMATIAKRDATLVDESIDGAVPHYCRDVASHRSCPVAGSSTLGRGMLMTDQVGRQYTDYYQLVAENESRTDWEPMLPVLKRQFFSFEPSRGRGEATSSSLPGGTELCDSVSQGSGCTPSCTSIADSLVSVDGGGGDRFGAEISVCSSSRMVNSAAAHGNLLEAINQALDVLETTHEEVDLASTGKSIIVLSASTGWFDVDYKLSQVLPANSLRALCAYVRFP